MINRINGIIGIAIVIAMSDITILLLLSSLLFVVLLILLLFSVTITQPLVVN